MDFLQNPDSEGTLKGLLQDVIEQKIKAKAAQVAKDLIAGEVNSESVMEIQSLNRLHSFIADLTSMEEVEIVGILIDSGLMMEESFGVYKPQKGFSELAPDLVYYFRLFR